MRVNTVLLRIFCFCAICAALLPAVVAALPGQQACVPPECYPEPPPDDPTPSGPDTSGGWSGYRDGRLNPDMAEYYSIWCAYDRIEVWGGVPTPQLINTISLASVLALPVGGTLDGGAGLTVTRSGADTVIISGSNGNAAPNPGSKSFSLSECIARNGGAPALPTATLTPPPPNNSAALPTATPTPDPAEEAEGNVFLCLPGTTSLGEFIRCLNFFSPDTAPFEFFYLIWWAIVNFCAGNFVPFALVGALPAWRLWRRRRRK